MRASFARKCFIPDARFLTGRRVCFINRRAARVYIGWIKRLCTVLKVYIGRCLKLSFGFFHVSLTKNVAPEELK